MDSSMQTLKEAQSHVKHNINEGVVCPCCKQFVKVYPRKFNKGMAYALVTIFKVHIQKGKFDYIDVPEEFTKLGINPSNTEYSKLAYWFLLEKRVNDDTSKHSSGMYKLTEKGSEFVMNRLQIPKTVYMLNGEIQGYSDEKIFISEVSESFNYNELMGGTDSKATPKPQLNLFGEQSYKD